MSPRRNRNANRARRRRCYLCSAGRATYAGLCDECAAAELELESDPATWTIPGDGFADGGTPYSDDELELMRKPAA